MTFDKPPAQPQTKDGTHFDPASARALRITRWLWAAMLAGLLMTVGLASMVIATESLQARTEASLTLLPISFFLALVLCVVGYFLRMQTYKRYWVGHRITDHGYYTGNLILFALVYSAGLIGVMNMVLSDRLMPEVVPGALCVVLLGVNFPNGRPMLPRSRAL